MTKAPQVRASSPLPRTDRIFASGRRLYDLIKTVKIRPQQICNITQAKRTRRRGVSQSPRKPGGHRIGRSVFLDSAITVGHHSRSETDIYTEHGGFNLKEDVS